MVQGGSDLQHLLNAARHAWKRRWVLLAIQFAATAAAAAAILVLPKQYQSSTTIRVEKEKVINPLTRGLAVSSEMEERLRTLKEEILSRDYMEKVVARLGLGQAGATPIAHEEMIRRMVAGTSITVDTRQTDLFHITYAGPDPAQVRDVTNTLAGIFIEESLAFKESEAGAAFEFLKGQLEVYRRKLEESEQTLRNFEEQHVDELPAAKAALQARLDMLKTSLDEARNSIRQAKIQKEMLIQRIPVRLVAGKGGTAGEETVPNPLAERLKEKESHLAQLLRDYSESYPDVVNLRGEIESIRKEVARRPTVPVDELPAAAPTQMDQALLNQLQAADVELNTLMAREPQLAAEIERYQKKLQSIPQVEQEMARLKRDYDVNSDIYDMFLRRVEEARVSRELEVSKKGEVFRILQAAPLPLIPYKPKRLDALAAGVGAGLGLNLLLVMLVAMRDTSFRSAREAQDFLGLKVLAGIPLWTPSRGKGREAILSSAFGVACAGYLLTLVVFLFWERFQSVFRGG